MSGTNGPISAKGHNGTVEFDGQYVTIVRKGFLARASVGKGEKRIPLSSIAAVQWKPAGALVNGYIEFTIPGGRENRSRIGHATQDAAHNENAVVFTKSQMPAFQDLRTVIEDVQREQHEAATRPHVPQQAQQVNLSQELANLAALHQQGVLTADEFQRPSRG